MYSAGAPGLDVDVAWVEAAYGDAVLAALYGGGVGEADDAELGGGVGGGVGSGHLGGGAADVDYASATPGHHDPHGLAAAEEYACEVDGDDPLPSLEGELVQWGSRLDAGVVDGDVDTAEALNDVVEECGDLVLVSHVGLVCFDGTEGAHLGGGALHAVAVPGGDDDGGALGGEGAGYAPADAGGASGDDCDLGVEPGHAMLLGLA